MRRILQLKLVEIENEYYESWEMEEEDSHNELIECEIRMTKDE